MSNLSMHARAREPIIHATDIHMNWKSRKYIGVHAYTRKYDNYDYDDDDDAGLTCMVCDIYGSAGAGEVGGAGLAALVEEEHEVDRHV